MFLLIIRNLRKPPTVTILSYRKAESREVTDLRRSRGGLRMQPSICLESSRGWGRGCFHPRELSTQCPASPFPQAPPRLPGDADPKPRGPRARQKVTGLKNG